ncbi:MAG TPA: hypothetical protein DCZ93_03740 [Elusimicrobia bacterium]|nr:MAG: hypothetical protein A2X35_08520 [Elusimicrobia bacterium GWA2_61_42]OGR77279.1 MAG: hypothetical protein A2X38_09070 [Elusimicrobia bacterium GWC2_61_25]HBB66411.1 hypothetical protein [Elusimicrobiota bacterium]
MFAFSLRKFFWGIMIISVGGLIWASNLGYVGLSFRFGRDWPIIIVAIGLMSVWDALFGRHWWGHKFPGQRKEKKDSLSKVLEDLEQGKIDAAEAARRMGDK